MDTNQLAAIITALTAADSPTGQSSALIGETVMIRSDKSGVHYGTLTERHGNECVLTGARRVWFWAGAASLSELATSGPGDVESCKFPVAVATVIVSDVCEILPVTPVALAVLDSVPVWSQR